MTPGPLRRLIGTVGLIALTPTALMLATERIDPLDAALRAGATLLAALIIGRLAGWWVAEMARGYEATLAAQAADQQEGGEQPRRRAADQQGTFAGSEQS
jgi:hypothetical protein